jgi:hypothetical protein
MGCEARQGVERKRLGHQATEAMERHRMGLITTPDAFLGQPLFSVNCIGPLAHVQ